MAHQLDLETLQDLGKDQLIRMLLNPGSAAAAVSCKTETGVKSEKLDVVQPTQEGPGAAQPTPEGPVAHAVSADSSSTEGGALPTPEGLAAPAPVPVVSSSPESEPQPPVREPGAPVTSADETVSGLATGLADALSGPGVGDLAQPEPAPAASTSPLPSLASLDSPDTVVDDYQCLLEDNITEDLSFQATVVDELATGLADALGGPGAGDLAQPEPAPAASTSPLPSLASLDPPDRQPNSFSGFQQSQEDDYQCPLEDITEDLSFQETVVDDYQMPVEETGKDTRLAEGEFWRRRALLQSHLVTELPSDEDAEDLGALLKGHLSTELAIVEEPKDAVVDTSAEVEPELEDIIPAAAFTQLAGNDDEDTCRHCELRAGDWCAHCGLPPWSADHPRPIAEGAKRPKIGLLEAPDDPYKEPEFAWEDPYNDALTDVMTDDGYDALSLVSEDSGLSMIPQIDDDDFEDEDFDELLLNATNFLAAAEEPGDSVGMASIKQKHRDVLMTSYRNENAYMRFHRQARSKKKRLSKELIARFSTDKQSLFLDFLESGEDWDLVEIFEVRRQRAKKQAKTVYKLKTRKELLKQFDNDAETVDRICEGKRKMGLSCPNPECPDNRKFDVFYVRDEVSMTDMHEQSVDKEMRIQGQLDKEATKALFDGAMFSDTATPIRAPMPAKLWDTITSSLQPGVSHGVSDSEIIEVTKAPACSTPPQTISDVAAQALLALLPKDVQNCLLLARGESPAAGGAGGQAPEGKAVGTESAGGQSNKHGRDEGSKPEPAKAPKRQRGAKGEGKSKSKSPMTPLKNGRALQQQALSDAAQARNLAKQVGQVPGQESMAHLLKDYEQKFDELFESCSVLIKADDDTEEGWKDAQKTSLTLKNEVKESINICQTILSGVKRIEKQAVAAKEKKEKDQACYARCVAASTAGA